MNWRGLGRRSESQDRAADEGRSLPLGEHTESFGTSKVMGNSRKKAGRLGWNFLERIALQANVNAVIQVPEDMDDGIDG